MKASLAGSDSNALAAAASARTVINDKQTRATNLADEAIKHLQMFEEQSKNRGNDREEDPKKLLLWPVLLESAENNANGSLSSARTTGPSPIKWTGFNSKYA